jgi:hypothetical protein
MAGPFHADNCCKIAISLIDLCKAFERKRLAHPSILFHSPSCDAQP